MKILLSILVIFLFSTQSQATLRLSLGTGMYLKKITGSHPTTLASGTLISNSSFAYGLNMNFGISKRWHLLMGTRTIKYTFENSDNIVLAEDTIDTTHSHVGLRWILFSRTSLRFLFNMDETIAFTVDDLNNAVLYKENINYLTLYYDQIVYLGAKVFAGFKLGYDVPSDGTEVIEQQSTRYGLFMNYKTGRLGQFEVIYEVREGTKSDAILDFVEKDDSLLVIYTVRF